MRISDWSSDVCSSDLHAAAASADAYGPFLEDRVVVAGADDAAQEADIAAEAEDFGAQAADESFVGIEARIAGVVGQLVADARPQGRAFLRADQQRGIAVDVRDLAILQRVAHHVAQLLDRKSTSLNSSHQ